MNIEIKKSKKPIKYEEAIKFMALIKKIKDKKVNFEFNKEYIKVVTDKISSNDAQFITNSFKEMHPADAADIICLLYTSPSPRDMRRSRMPSSA